MTQLPYPVEQGSVRRPQQRQLAQICQRGGGTTRSQQLRGDVSAPYGHDFEIDYLRRSQPLPGQALPGELSIGPVITQRHR